MAPRPLPSATKRYSEQLNSAQYKIMLHTLLSEQQCQLNIITEV